MTKLPVARGAEVVRALQRAGFAVSHVRGGHYYLKREGSARLVVVLSIVAAVTCRRALCVRFCGRPS